MTIDKRQQFSVSMQADTRPIIDDIRACMGQRDHVRYTKSQVVHIALARLARDLGLDMDKYAPPAAPKGGRHA